MAKRPKYFASAHLYDQNSSRSGETKNQCTKTPFLCIGFRLIVSGIYFSSACMYSLLYPLRAYEVYKERPLSDPHTTLPLLTEPNLPTALYNWHPFTWATKISPYPVNRGHKLAQSSYLEGLTYRAGAHEGVKETKGGIPLYSGKPYAFEEWKLRAMTV